MKVLGVVTEYNPFHNGHRYHIEKSREITGCHRGVGVMSGHFLQRGEPALLNKWQRAEMAVMGGVDLMLEIPTVYACATAEFFSYGSLQLLNKTGIVTDLAFGSEHGELTALQRIAKVLVADPELYRRHLKEALGKGLLFPTARAEALGRYLSETEGLGAEDLHRLKGILKSPNNILAIEYLKALLRTKSSIRPHTLTRVGAGYHDRGIEGSIASATAIREHLAAGGPLNELQQVLPTASWQQLAEAVDSGGAPVFSRHFEKVLLALIRRSRPSELKRLFDVTEGIENRILTAARQNTSLTELLEAVKTRRYTYTRIQRILIHLMLDLAKEDLRDFNRQGGPQYLRVLAFNERGRELLSLMKKRGRLPIVTNLKNYRPQNPAAEKMLEFDLRATDLYRLGLPEPKALPYGAEYKNRPRYVK